MDTTTANTTTALTATLTDPPRRRLTAGINHLALLTDDLDRLCAFYVDVFDAEIAWVLDEGPVRHAMIDVGAGACLHPFQLPDNAHGVGSPAMFDRGHLDHVAVNAADDEAFDLLRRRLVEAGASDGTITDFGIGRSVFYRDPDGGECEVAQWTPGRELLTFDERRQIPYPAPGH